MHFRVFPSLLENPLKIGFENQDSDEKIELFMRRHWIANIPWILSAVFAAFIPFVILQIEQFLGLNIFTQVPLQLLLGGLIIYYMLIMAYIIESFVFWYFNVDIVTDAHIVDINFYSLLSREINEIGLEDIEIISRRAKGILDSLLDYGDVVIETAAETKNIELATISKPDFVVNKIQDLREARKLFYEEGGE
jgi:hypothetical protein